MADWRVMKSLGKNGGIVVTMKGDSTGLVQYHSVALCEKVLHWSQQLDLQYSAIVLGYTVFRSFVCFLVILANETTTTKKTFKMFA